MKPRRFDPMKSTSTRGLTLLATLGAAVLIAAPIAAQEVVKDRREELRRQYQNATSPEEKIRILRELTTQTCGEVSALPVELQEKLQEIVRNLPPTGARSTTGSSTTRRSSAPPRMCRWTMGRASSRFNLTC